MSTFRKAAKIALENGEHISLGGGEPTLHPRFWEIVGLALGHSDEMPPWMATNGSVTETAIALAHMAQRGVMGVALSLDSFHDPIDPRVLDAFDAAWFVPGMDLRQWHMRHRENDLRDIYCNDGKLIEVGRAAENGIADITDRCLCDEVFVTPDGTIYACGCQQVVLGHVDDGDYARPDNGLLDCGCSGEYARSLREDGETGPLDMDELVLVFGKELAQPSRIGLALMAEGGAA